MKKFIVRLMSFAVFLIPLSIEAQVVFYSAPFSGGNFHSWTSQNLGAPWGNFDPSYNIWKVNTNESGQPANVCGTTGAPSTLHMCSNFATGAAYISNYYSNRRISSPNISTVGYSSLTLGFNFIGNGCSTRDKAYLQYSIDGGASWLSPLVAPTTANPAMGTGGNLNNLKSQVCGSGQGRWTNITWSLPATCENIPNLRIAFVWQNNDGVGGCSSSPSDPSFAVYNLTISSPTDLPVEMLYFKGNKQNDGVMLEWATISELNNDFFMVQKSYEAFQFIDMEKIAGAGNSNLPLHYSYFDPDMGSAEVYYRLKQTDFDGTESFSKIIAFQPDEVPQLSVYPNPVDDVLFIDISQVRGDDVSIEIFNTSGQLVFAESYVAEYDHESFNVDVSNLPKGAYLVRVVSGQQQFLRKLNRQ